MAKRGRHPGRKSQTRSHNKTPKLSPFQREQKRNRLANQAPTALSVSNEGRQYSRSQREVFKYFEKRDAAEAEKKLLGPPSGALRNESATMGKARARKLLRGSGGAPSTGPVTAEKARPEVCNGGDVSSLNACLLQGATSIENRMLQDTTLAIITKKKAKKHERKKLLRRQRLDNLVEEGDARVREELQHEKEKRSKKLGKKARRQMEAEERAAAKAAAAASSSVNNGDEEGMEGAAPSSTRHGKSISFDGAVADVSHREMKFPGDRQADGKAKPKEFYELVDVVKFGERVDAPPVLSVLPDAKSRFSRLGLKLLEEEETRPMKRRREEGDQRHTLLGGNTQIAEHKRLVKLGLAAPAAASSSSEAFTAHETAEASRQGGKSKQDEFAMLREKVMETYRRNKAAHHHGRTGTNLNHVFPALS